MKRKIKPKDLEKDDYVVLHLENEQIPYCEFKVLQIQENKNNNLKVVGKGRQGHTVTYNVNKNRVNTVSGKYHVEQTYKKRV